MQRAVAPVYDSDGNIVAIVDIYMSMTNYIVTLEIYVIVIAVTILLVLLITNIGFYRWMKKDVLLPIRKLWDVTGHLKEGLETETLICPDIHTGDEIEELADAFVDMEKDLFDYVKENARITEERGRISAELDVATKVQSDMLPGISPTFTDESAFVLDASMTPAKEVGGDFYDFFYIDSDHVAIVIADVSGKGIAANAGHDHPVLRRAGAKWELIEYEHDLPLAVMEGMSFSEHAFEVHPGDSLFVYTDGVPEATNADGELFGEKRMVNALNASRDDHPARFLKSLKSQVDAFVGDAPQFDDITMVGPTWNGSGA